MKAPDVAPLPGKESGDPHKNTAKCGSVNDRERRRAKRIERREFKLMIRQCQQQTA